MQAMPEMSAHNIIPPITLFSAVPMNKPIKLAITITITAMTDLNIVFTSAPCKPPTGERSIAFYS